MNLLVTATVILLVVTSNPTSGEIKGPLMPMCGEAMCSTEELIKKLGRKGETHTVTTDDGYILTIFRMLGDKPDKMPVVIQHGLAASSDCWLSHNRSLAMRVNEAGYDVWLTNSRGNIYGRNHTTLNPAKDKQFWDFSFHEMATKDIPAIMDYMVNTTGKNKMHYMGHSLGTTMALVALSLNPHLADKMNSIFLYSPIVYLSKVQEMLGPDGMAEEMAKTYMEKFATDGKLELFPRHDVPPDPKTQVTCGDVEENFRDMCTEKMEAGKEVMGGWYLPAGTSMKNIKHLYQSGIYGEIRHFNMTPEENKKAYGSEEPPKYTSGFKNIKPPIVVFTSTEDELVLPEDLEKLTPLLPDGTLYNNIGTEGFTHMGFVIPMEEENMADLEKMCDDTLQLLETF